MLRRAGISGMGFDSITKEPFMVLKEVDGERSLPIWIGALEAYAIVYELQGFKTPRPMTHDLMTNLMKLINVQINKTVVCDLKENTFYASIHFKCKDRELVVDARPSDALALSLRAGAPIFVEESVFVKVAELNPKMTPEDTSEQGKKWQKFLEELKSDEFGHT